MSSARDLVALREVQVNYLTVRGAAGNVAGACSVPLLLLDTRTDPQTRQAAQLAYAACAQAMSALDALCALLGEEMTRRQRTT